MKYIGWLILAVFLGAAGFAVFYMVYPDLSKLKKENPGTTALMEYREKEWKAKGKKVRIRHRWVGLKQVSPYVMKAVLIAEDDKFWAHKGFDFDAIQKAVEKDLKEGKFKFGGSTVSQQLVKNLYLTPAKNPVRKIKEAIITWRLERTLTKQRILELYLNVVEWGEGRFGIWAAAEGHFGKAPSQLTAEESATLAAVLPNPRKFRTDGSSRYVQRRARVIYDIMVRRGIVVPDYDEVIEGTERTEPSPEQ